MNKPPETFRGAGGKFYRQLKMAICGLMVVGLLQSNAQLPDVHTLWKPTEKQKFLKIATAFSIMCASIFTQEIYVGANAF